MKKLLILTLALFAFAFTAEAQKKGESTPVTEARTDSPLFEFIYGGDSRENTGLRILVQDRHRQYVAMGQSRLRAQAKSDDPINYWVKLIAIPEVNPLAFKQAETLEENAQAEDGVTVLIVRYKDLEEARLTWYNSQ